ncbi:MAG: DGQHR domain-containing protein [Patescibacteria group bacterium]
MKISLKDEWVEFQSIKVRQPIGDFYMGVMQMQDLVDISYSDIRHRERNETEIEKYIGIQRPLSASRVKEIARYVNLVDAAFPTAIILSVSSTNVQYDEKSSRMRIRRDGEIAKILDGQHRAAGFEKASPRPSSFETNVAIFVDIDLEDQAILFATINKSQTKVNKSLVADLFAFATSRSPQKTAHQIVRALNEKEGSPFEGKVKILGVAEDGERETITQATFVEYLLKYLSLNPMTDRDIYKRGGVPKRAEGDSASKLIFRNLFLEEKDAEIAQIVWNYFSAVSLKWPDAWNEVRVQMILNKSTGFVALMRFMRDVYLSFDTPGKVASKEDFQQVFARIDLKQDDFTKSRYIPGGQGQSDLYKDLMEKSGLSTR